MFINQRPPCLSLLDKFGFEFPAVKLTTILVMSIGTLQFRVLIEDYAQKPSEASRGLMNQALPDAGIKLKCITIDLLNLLFGKIGY
jgi:hypothetical protein